jgi:hypothetical protein
MIRAVARSGALEDVITCHIGRLPALTETVSRPER